MKDSAGGTRHSPSIEITPEMLDAGLEALYAFDPNFGTHENAVEVIWEAMERARLGLPIPEDVRDFSVNQLAPSIMTALMQNNDLNERIAPEDRSLQSRSRILHIWKEA